MTFPGQSFGDPGSATRQANVVLNADVSGYTRQLGVASQQTSALAANVGTLQQRLGGLDKWAGRSLLKVSAGDFAILGAGAADAATFEKQLSTLSATAAVTGTSMKGLRNGIESTFTKFGTSRGDVIALTEALTNMGVTGERQITSLTQTFIKLGAATGESSIGLAQGLTQLSRLMGVTDATQIGNMANSLLTVSKNAGVSATGVLNFAQSIAPMARQAGIGESAVLGISTAFSKAGADGYVAANTFNSMISDITQLINSGSPEIAKYANLIGVTSTQFKKMDKTTAFTDILESLQKQGPEAINTLNELGQNGVRAQSALAAVTQSGDLRKQVALALGSQTDQGNLNKGAEAAFDNLADSLSRTRNAFTELGTVIGTTFLKPLSFVVDIAGTATRALTGLIHPFSAILGIAGAAGGVAAGVGGVAMNAAGMIGTVALARMVTRGTHAASFMGGVRGQMRGLSGLNERDTATAERYTGGQMSPVQRTMYQMGMGFGRLATGINPTAQLDQRHAQLRNEYTSGRMGGPDRQAYHMGMQYGRAVPSDAMSAGSARDRLTSERANMSGSQYRSYQAGIAYGQLPMGSLRDPGTWRNLALAAPFRAVSALNAGNAAMLRESTRDSWDRLRYRDQTPRISMGDRFNRMVGETAGRGVTDLVGGEARRTARGLGDLGGAYAQAGTTMAGRMFQRAVRYGAPAMVTSMVGGLAGVPYAGRALNQIRRQGGTGGVDEAGTRVVGGAKDFAYGLGVAMRQPKESMSILARSAGATAIALKDLGLRASGAAISSTVGGGMRVASQVGGAAADLVKGIGRFAFSLPGALALSGGTALYHRWQDTDKKSNVDQYLNPIQKYNDMLGTTTSNLATFSSTLVDAAQAAGAAHAVTMKQAASVGAGDVSNAPNDPKNQIFNTIRKRDAGSDKVSAYAAALSTLPISDPKQLQAAKEDMLASGVSQADAQAALDMYMRNGGPSATSGLQLSFGGLNTLGTTVANDEGLGLNFRGGPNPSKSGGQVIGQALSGIDSQRVSDEQRVGGAYAQQSALQRYAQFLAPVAQRTQTGDSSTVRSSNMKAMAQALHQIAGGSVNDYMNYISEHGAPKDWKDGGTGQEQYVVKALGATKQGRRWEKALTGAGGTLNIGDMDQRIRDLSNTADDSSFNGLLRRHGGALGAFAASSTTVQSAIGINQGSPGYINQSVEALLKQAARLGGGLDGAAVQLEKFQGTLGDTSGALYKQTLAAQQLAVQQAGYEQPFRTRQQNFGTTVRNYEGAEAAYNDTPVSKRTDDQYQFVQSQKAAYESSLADQQSYMQQMYQTAQQYGVQMQRGAEDEAESEFRSRRNFHIQMLQSEQDFNIQMMRTQQDHNTQLRNQAQQAAQDIYDPFTRVQSQYTTDAGTLLQNLQDQNERIGEQMAQLRQAERMGLSQQAVQTLSLADPKNAQELNSIVSTLTPAQARKINKQVSSRVSDTGRLVNNPLVLAFAQGEQEFHKQLDRSQADYERSTKRAREQQQMSLDDMSKDYNKTVRRAGEDLTTTMKEVTGSFGKMYDRTMGQIAKSVQKFSPQAAAQMRKDLSGLVKDFPYLLAGDPTGYGGTPGTPAAGQIAGPGVRKSNKADVVGINDKGQQGYYDQAGGFHKHSIAPMLPAAAPHVYPPGTKFAMGGISTAHQYGEISENNRPELFVPLDDRGTQFMATFAEGVTRQVLQSLHTAGRGVPGTGMSNLTTVYNQDHSTTFSGPISIEAADLQDMIKQLAAKQRLARLQKPAHTRS